MPPFWSPGGAQVTPPELVFPAPVTPPELFLQAVPVTLYALPAPFTPPFHHPERRQKRLGGDLAGLAGLAVPESCV